MEQDPGVEHVAHCAQGVIHPVPRATRRQTPSPIIHGHDHPRPAPDELDRSHGQPKTEKQAYEEDEEKDEVKVVDRETMVEVKVSVR